MAAIVPAPAPMVHGGNDDDSAAAAVNWGSRLVWAELCLEDEAGEIRKFWWPALRFLDMMEFDAENTAEAEASGDVNYRVDLAMCMMKKTQEGGSAAIQVVRFLGRPLGDMQAVAEGEYHDFVSCLGHFLQACICKPAHFEEVTQSPQEAQTLYVDFHRGMDATAQVLAMSGSRRRNSIQSWVTKADAAWEAMYGVKPVSSTQAPVVPTASSPPRAPYPRHHQQAASSPNHSVAAVSVAEESTAGAAHSHAAAMTPASTVASDMSRYSSANQQQQHQPQNESSSSSEGREKWDMSRFPAPLHPLGMVPWVETKVPLLCAGWTRYQDASTGAYRYQPYGGGPDLSEAEIQRVAQERFGWQPPRETSSQAPNTPQRNPPRVLSAPESNGKDYSFGILWKHKLMPNGWCRVKPPREAAKFFDYCYLRPGVTLENLDSKQEGEDYFYNHYDILDWCRRENYYPTDCSSGSSMMDEGDESTVASNFPVENHPATVLEEVLSDTKITNRSGRTKNHKSKKANQKKKERGPPNHRNYTFGVLWACHLEPNGWTMPKAKNNQLVDYYYVRPGRSHETGKSGEDYFEYTDDVLKYCEAHNDYPDSSSCGVGSPDEATITTNAEVSTIAHEDTTDDESTKHPVETEDEHTLGDYSTPGTRTQPQDPGKPRDASSDEDESEPELDDATKYHWTNLWPYLRERGWKWQKPKNPLDDYWYIPPRPLELDPNEAPAEMKPGVDYFCSPEEVTAHIREMERDEAALAAASKSDRAEDARQVEAMEEDAPEPKPSKASKKSQAVHSKTSDSKRRANDRGEKASGQGGSKKANKKDKTSVSVEKEIEVSEISVHIMVEENRAPWVTDPLPKNDLHRMVTVVGGSNFTGSRYIPHDESGQNPGISFSDSSEVLKYMSSLGEGNYYVNPECNDMEIETYHRLVAYAFAPGRDYEQCQTRPLTLPEIEACLEKVYKFTRSESRWEPPTFLIGEGPGMLKPSYDSLGELLRALRGVEHLEGKHHRRNRKPMDQKEAVVQREQLNMAFRLSIAEDKIVRSLEKNAKNGSKTKARSLLQKKQDNAVDDSPPSESEHSRPASATKVKSDKKDELDFSNDASNKPSNRRRPKVLSSSNELDFPSDSEQSQSSDSAAEEGNGNNGLKGATRSSQKQMQGNESDFSSDSNKTSSRRVPRSQFLSQDSLATTGVVKRSRSTTPTSSAKKQKKEPQISDLKVKASEPNDAPWAGPVIQVTFTVVRKVGVTYQSGYYYLPGEDVRIYTARFLSVDDVIKHWCNYGEYNLEGLDEEERLAVERKIRYGNVPGPASLWKLIRKLETFEAILILNLYQIEEQPDGSWLVPETLLRQRKYYSLDELRVALRSIKDFEGASVGRRARGNRKLTEHQYIAFRLWLADGPPGPINTISAKPMLAEVAGKDATSSGELTILDRDAPEEVAESSMDIDQANTPTLVVNESSNSPGDQCNDLDDSKDDQAMEEPTETNAPAPEQTPAPETEAAKKADLTPLKETGVSDNVGWVECNKCKKWRTLPAHISAAELPDVWYCPMNTWNPTSASCDAPEDKADEIAGQEKEASMEPERQRDSSEENPVHSPGKTGPCAVGGMGNAEESSPLYTFRKPNEDPFECSEEGSVPGSPDAEERFPLTQPIFSPIEKDDSKFDGLLTQAQQEY